MRPEAISDMRPAEKDKVTRLFESQRQSHFRKMDGMFMYLMVAQWIFAVLVALFYSPYSWEGKEKVFHIHLYLAFFMGGGISLFPILLAKYKPGWIFTRHVIAFTQMLWSALLIHLTGGRIETHFHVFGSLAFIAFYCEWPLLVTATLVIVVDHLLRGLIYPESVYGIVNPEWWRFLEHTFWVIFEDVILIWSCLEGVKAVRENARRQIEVETLAESNQLKTAELAKEKIKLERSNKELEQFAGIAAHDLRSPLKSMWNWIDMLDMNAPKPRSERLDQAIDYIKVNAKKANALIDDLLEVARLNIPNAPLENVDLNKVMGNLLNVMKQDIENTGAQVRCDTLPTVRGISSHLESLFSNLIRNALLYREKSRKPEILIGCQETSEFYEFVVKDNGIGIGEEYTGRIFEMFNRLHGEREYPGTGIGLAYSKKVVELRGGKIWVNSVLGTGSSFFFTYPRNSEGKTS